ncbi:MAG: integrase [Rhodobacteraceae bacterium]|nr:integrase [Paracoccaceae bacterium]MBO29440.1 integrase [Paracoccaceae bacterium]
MPAINKLTATKIRTAAPGKYNDGGGLWLHKRTDGGAQWFLRLTIHGRRREMGLGPLSEVSLKEARECASRWRAVKREGKDPIKERQRLQRVATKSDHSLRAIAEATLAAKRSELKGDTNASRWISPLRIHVFPKLGQVPVEELDQQDIRSTLAPIWHSKADTARKALNRLNLVLKHAVAMGLDVDVSAPEKAKILLGKTSHVSRNIPDLHWQDVPKFYSALNQGTVNQLALRLLILTALRSRPIRFARWEQIDGDLWTVPAENMKGLKGKTASLRVPLSQEALRVLDEAKPFERDGYIFPGQRTGVISDRTMASLMEDRDMKERS